MGFVGEARITSDHEQAAEVRERSNDVLSDSIGEKLVARVTAHIGKPQDSDRRFLRYREWLWLQLGFWCAQRRVDSHRPGEIFDVLLACESERCRKLALYLINHLPRDKDATLLRDLLQASCDVHPVSVPVVLDDEMMPMRNLRGSSEPSGAR